MNHQGWDRLERDKTHRASWFFLTLLFTAATISLCTHAEAQASQKHAARNPSVSIAERGKELYTSSGCYECHGREGQGSRMSGPRIGPPPMDLSSFTEYIRQPGGQMPPYTSKVLSDAELADIYAFLKSLPPPPSLKNIPLLNDSK